MSGDGAAFTTLQFGDWRICLHPLAHSGEDYFDRVLDRFYPFVKKLTAPQSGIDFLTLGNRPLPLAPVYPAGLSEPDIPTWDQFWIKNREAYSQFSKAQSRLVCDERGWTECFTFSWPEFGKNGFHVDEAVSQPVDRFSCLICHGSDNKVESALFIYSLLLAARWHARHSGLCLHASAINRISQGLLFLGVSEAGKSTIAQFGMQAGYDALGDDINFIVRSGDNFYLAAGPSAQLMTGAYSPARPHLRGIFALVQDTYDALVPLSPRKTALALYDSLMQSPPGHKLMGEYLRRSIRTIGDLARTIPGYELHFRKSPDFWKLIDAEFPD